MTSDELGVGLHLHCEVAQEMPCAFTNSESSGSHHAASQTPTQFWPEVFISMLHDIVEGPSPHVSLGVCHAQWSPFRSWPED